LIITSPDGVNWTRKTKGVYRELFDITYGKDTFIAVGANGTILKMIYSNNDWQIVGGFTEKNVSSSKTAYKLFDGNWLNFNSNGSVTWNS
jgi:hypothetical protein